MRVWHDPWAIGITETQAREEICRVGQSLFARGYVHSTSGNISVRRDDAEGGGLVMTPTDACLGFLDPTRLSRIDVDGHQTSGDKASKTLALHRPIYAAARAFDPATACVMHTHSTYCVAASLETTGSELLPALTLRFFRLLGRSVTRRNCLITYSASDLLYSRVGRSAATATLRRSRKIYAAVPDA